MTIEINTPDDLAKHLKTLRKRYKVTQHELAIEIKVADETILRYEKFQNKIPMDKAIEIMQYFVNNHIKKRLILSIMPTNAKKQTEDNSLTSISNAGA